MILVTAIIVALADASPEAADGSPEAIEWIGAVVLELPEARRVG
jgi:hypothetical protein